MLLFNTDSRQPGRRLIAMRANTGLAGLGQIGKESDQFAEYINSQISKLEAVQARGVTVGEEKSTIDYIRELFSQVTKSYHVEILRPDINAEERDRAALLKSKFDRKYMYVLGQLEVKVTGKPGNGAGNFNKILIGGIVALLAINLIPKLAGR